MAAYWIGGACAFAALLLILAPGIHAPAAVCAGFTVMVWERGGLIGKARARRAVG